MHYAFIPYAIPLCASSLVSLALIVFGVTHREVRGTRELVAACCAGFIWSTANMLEKTGLDLATKLFWANVQYVPCTFSPMLGLALVCRFGGMDRFLTARNYLLASLLPLATSVLVWLDPTLGLVRHSFSLDRAGAGSIILKSYGPWFIVHYIGSSVFNVLALSILVNAVTRKGSVYRYQSSVLLVGVGLMVAANLAYVLGLSPAPRHDLTPLVYGVSSAIMWWGIFRFRIFKVIPVARATVFERMSSGILVVDEELNLLDCNDAARRMFGLEDFSRADASLRKAHPEFSEWIREIPASAIEEGRFQRELRLEGPGGGRFLELSASRLLDSRYKSSWVVIATDVTDMRAALDQIIRQREELAAGAERERISRELHDNLGQVLSFSVIQTDVALREMGKGNHGLAVTYLTRLRDILKGTHGELRSFVREVREAEYGTITLKALLERELDVFRESCGWEVSVTASPDGRWPELEPFQKMQLVKVAKEALTNAAKHAGASAVSIHLDAADGGWEISIVDNGVGLPDGVGAFRGGSGCDIMEERARSINGELRLENAEEGGTRVAVRFPASLEEAL